MNLLDLINFVVSILIIFYIIIPFIIYCVRSIKRYYNNKKENSHIILYQKMKRILK
jgi:uncharacterized protein YpmB